jgi:prepilin-type N-terminal cleavage/methylation domain-containing protein
MKFIYAGDNGFMTRLSKAMPIKRQKSRGFTLIEMLLVLAILAGMMVMFLNYSTQKARETRRDLAVLQIQEILNAGLSFYVNNGYWPVSSKKDCSDPQPNEGILILTNNGYLPQGFGRTPFGSTYKLTCNATSNRFSVETWFPNITEATVVKGRLPLATILTPADNSVQASVNLPGQNLNNARAVNFANLYKHGACVPAPKCPAPNMVPQIMVIPVSVSGVAEGYSAASPKINPISSFTAYAYGAPGALTQPALNGSSVALCNNPSQGAACVAGSGGSIDVGTSYWRVCLRVQTPEGDTSNIDNRPDVILAITRCAPPAEPSGSDFNVFVK